MRFLRKRRRRRLSLLLVMTLKRGREEEEALRSPPLKSITWPREGPEAHESLLPSPLLFPS